MRSICLVLLPALGAGCDSPEPPASPDASPPPVVDRAPLTEAWQRSVTHGALGRSSGGFAATADGVAFVLDKLFAIDATGEVQEPADLVDVDQMRRGDQVIGLPGGGVAVMYHGLYDYASTRWVQRYDSALRPTGAEADWTVLMTDYAAARLVFDIDGALHSLEISSSRIDLFAIPLEGSAAPATVIMREPIDAGLGAAVTSGGDLAVCGSDGQGPVLVVTSPDGQQVASHRLTFSRMDYCRLVGNQYGLAAVWGEQRSSFGEPDGIRMALIDPAGENWSPLPGLSLPGGQILGVGLSGEQLVVVYRQGDYAQPAMPQTAYRFSLREGALLGEHALGTADISEVVVRDDGLYLFRYNYPSASVTKYLLPDESTTAD